MKNTKIITSIFFIFFTFIFISGCDLSNTDNSTAAVEETSELTPIEKTYQNAVQSFETVTTTDLSTKDGSYFLYTGRITCPYCLAFVPKLHKASLSPEITGISIKYLNSENEDDTGLDKFIESNNIEYVPHFSYFKDGTLIKTMDVTDVTTSEEIQEFMNSMKLE